MKKIIIFCLLIISINNAFALDTNQNAVSSKIEVAKNNKDYNAMKIGTMFFLNKYKYPIVDFEEKFKVTIISFISMKDAIFINITIEQESTKKVFKKSVSHMKNKDNTKILNDPYFADLLLENNINNKNEIEEVLCGEEIAKKAISVFWAIAFNFKI